MTDAPHLLVYDGDCGVCTRAAEWVARRGEIELVPFDDLSDDQIARLPDDWRQCAHFFADGDVYSCGRAMEEAFLRTRHPATGLVRSARLLPGAATLREFGYRQFATHRGLVGTVLRRFERR